MKDKACWHNQLQILDDYAHEEVGELNFNFGDDSSSTLVQEVKWSLWPNQSYHISANVSGIGWMPPP